MFIDENTPKDVLLKVIAEEPELVQAFREMNILPEMQNKESLFFVVHNWIMSGNETHPTCH